MSSRQRRSRWPPASRSRMPPARKLSTQRHRQDEAVGRDLQLPRRPEVAGRLARQPRPTSSWLTRSPATRNLALPASSPATRPPALSSTVPATPSHTAARRPDPDLLRALLAVLPVQPADRVRRPLQGQDPQRRSRQGLARPCPKSLRNPGATAPT